MGYGTGVLRAQYMYCVLRGLSVGTIGVTGGIIVLQSGAAQNYLFLARGIGLVVGPLVLSKVIDRCFFSGESQSFFAVMMLLKMCAAIVIPRVTFQAGAYLSFFVLGLCSATLDTQLNTLVAKVHGINTSFYMILYCFVYGTGCMVAPFFAVNLQLKAWDALAVVDFFTMSYIVYRRLIGKPTEWKAKLRAPRNDRGEADSHPAGGQLQPRPRVPRRALAAGMAFIFVVEACETAMSCWCYTFASTVLQLPPGTAGWFPSAFYMGFTGARFIVLPLSRWLLPSTIAHLGSFLIISGCVAFNILTGLVAANPADTYVYVGPLLFSLFAIGSGSSPLYATTLASIERLGDLTAQEVGLYSSSAAMGMCAGNFTPGVVPLPTMELIGAICVLCILNSHLRFFPLRKPNLAEACPKAVPSEA